MAHSEGQPSPQPAGQPPVRLVVGSVEPHAIEVTYSAPLRLLRVRLDGRTAYRHCGLVPWASRKAREIRTPGGELHTLIVAPADRHRAGYRLWLDGTPVARGDDRALRLT